MKPLDAFAVEKCDFDLFIGIKFSAVEPPIRGLFCF
jgi:hypothetical protein